VVKNFSSAGKCHSPTKFADITTQVAGRLKPAERNSPFWDVLGCVRYTGFTSPRRIAFDCDCGLGFRNCAEEAGSTTPGCRASGGRVIIRRAATSWRRGWLLRAQRRRSRRSGGLCGFGDGFGHGVVWRNLEEDGVGLGALDFLHGDGGLHASPRVAGDGQDERGE